MHAAFAFVACAAIPVVWAASMEGDVLGRLIALNISLILCLIPAWIAHAEDEERRRIPPRK